MKTPSGYSGLQIGLHWLIAILIAVNYFSGGAMGAAFDGTIEGTGGASFGSSIHVYVGLSILALVLIRLGVRLTQGVPETPAGTPAILTRLGGLAHLLLYGFLIVVPSLGAFAWFRLSESAGNLHVLIMNLMLIVIGLHTVAALFHHFVLKDGLILRMLRPAPRS